MSKLSLSSLRDSPPTPRRRDDGVTRRRIKLEAVGPGLQDTFAASKARRAELSYRAAEPSKLRSRRIDLGGTANTHFVHGDDYWRIREAVRAFERDNALIAQIVDRAADQVLGNGLQVDPTTGSDELNARILALWNDWAENPDACDFAGRLTFDAIERLALRHRWIDGDCFVILDDATGSVRLVEGDRVQAHATGVQKVDGREVEVVLGVEVELRSGRAVAYHFVKQVTSERRGYLSYPLGSPNLVRLPADQVLHIYEPKRVTQYRGITAFHAVFDRISLLEDIEFAELVKLQVASCIAGFVQTEHDAFQLGARTTETGNDNATELTFDEFSPGMIVKLPQGAKVETFAPSVTTQDTADQKRQIIREIGLAVGLPLELTLLDHGNSSFSANRATLESYKRTARNQQRWIARSLRSKVYEWKVRQWVAAGLLPDDPNVTRHVVHFPEWTFLDPQKEATADNLRLVGNLASHRQVWAERGRDFDDGKREIAEDRAGLVLALHEKAEELVSKGVEGVTWRDLLTVAGQNPAAKPTTPPGDRNTGGNDGETASGRTGEGQ